MEIQQEIDKRLGVEGYTNEINVNHIRDAIAKLKNGKNGGEEGLFSDHVINGTNLLAVWLTCLFNCMLSHGICPSSTSHGTMVPIPNDKRKSVGCSDNYRAITLSSIIGKVFDWVIILTEKDNLISSDMQFGFKEHFSTSQCTFVMSEIISYYNYNRSDVYVMLLDATKAFDRVNYSRLLRKLLRRNISPAVLRVLLKLYTNQFLQVNWGSKCSGKFSVQNGVKQDGVLSPILFSVYLDDLFSKLQESGIGCKLGNSYAGCLAYADDLSFLSPTKKGLQKLVDLCEECAIENDILFNGNKSQFLIFKGRGNSPKDFCHINVNGSCVWNVEQATHLGHCLSKKMILIALLVGLTGTFWRSFNIFSSDFGHINSTLQSRLFKQHCCSFMVLHCALL